MKSFKLNQLTVVVGLSAVMAILNAEANPITFNVSDNSGRSAEATFAQSGSTLTLTLENTATADLTTGDNPYLLGALFFSLPGNPTLSVASEILAPNGSHYLYPWATSPTDITGEWSYGSFTSGTPGGATSGISSVGYGLNGFGSNVKGGDYSLTTAGDDGSTPSGDQGLFHPVIQNGVQFTFNLPAGYTLTSVGDIHFQYGTALDDADLTVPDGGSSLALFGCGLLGMLLLCTLRKEGSRSADARAR